MVQPDDYFDLQPAIEGGAGHAGRKTDKININHIKVLRQGCFRAFSMPFDRGKRSVAV